MNNATRVVVWRLVMMLLICGTAQSQDPTATLVGVVKDSSGARVPHASVSILPEGLTQTRVVASNNLGEFSMAGVAPGTYTVEVNAPGFAPWVYRNFGVAVGSRPTLAVTLGVQAVRQNVTVRDEGLSIQRVETTSSVITSVITANDLQELPLAHRSFANIAYLSPMTEPVEPSDPTKARITAVSFAGSSGLNADLSVDGGDNNDDFIGGFLQNYSPDAMQEFTVRTAQFDANTSRTNGGSVIIASKRGSNQWHGSLAGYFRGSALNARNELDNPAPDPKQPFSRQNYVGTLGGPIVRDKVWFFTSAEYVHEDASIAYSNSSKTQFRALAGLAGEGLIPGVPRIDIPTSVPVPFRDTLFDARLDWAQSQRSQWYAREAFDLNLTRNDLVQQATLPSTGATTTSHYQSFLIGQQYVFSPRWLGTLTLEQSEFHHVKQRNSELGLALAFPFSANFHTTSGFETFGDNQFATPITAFPIQRDQQKYQFRYDISYAGGTHSPKFGVNFIHEPVLRGRLADSAETLAVFSENPSFYLVNPAQFEADFAANTAVIPAGNGTFAQNVQRLGFYAQDSWRVLPSFTINYGLRYDTTFGLFEASGRSQAENPAVATLKALGVPLAPGIPHDYRGAVAPRLGIAYAPGGSTNTVVRLGVGMYYNDLTQNGWVDAFTAVNDGNALSSTHALMGPADQGAVIDPRYKTPYALQASAGVERAFGNNWRLESHYEHQQGVHQYRRYEYVSGVTLPASAPSISLFKTDNRSRYDGISFLAQHHSERLDLTAHYTLARASTWGATVGELFDYVNGVSDVRNPFGQGDHGPSGEDVRHRFVLAATWKLPWKFELATLAQVESARPFTLATPVDLNNDGRSDNDRAVINGVQTKLDQFRGVPFSQVDLRVSRDFQLGERTSVRPFAEFFNLLNRTNPGNNFVGYISALPLPVNSLANATAFCLNQSCSLTQPISNANQVRVPAGALGDFFGPGTTLGIPFAAQLGIRFSF
jgi:hypothetical protein